MITHAAARLVRRLRGPAHLVGGSRDAQSDGAPGLTDPMLAALAEGQRHFGRFLLLRIAGASARGVVWVARDEETAHSVALKFLADALARDRAVRASLKSAIERLRGLPAEEFVVARALHEDGPRAALSSELAEGNALGALREVRLNGCLDAAELLAWIEPFGAAFGKATERAGLFHGALHPWHLVLTPQGKVKVLDYALAELLARSAAKPAKGASRQETRAFLYSSPQLRGGAPATGSDDVYALGATIYDLLAGGPPYAREQLDAPDPRAAPMPIRERRAAHDCWGAPIPPAWEETLTACLQHEPAKRPQSVSAVIESLRRGLVAEAKLPAPAVTVPLEGRADTGSQLAPGKEGVEVPAAGAAPLKPEGLQGAEPAQVPEIGAAPLAAVPSATAARKTEPLAQQSEGTDTQAAPLAATSPGKAVEAQGAPPLASTISAAAAVLAWSAPAGAITATLPEVESARALAEQRAHHRGTLIALACLAVIVQAARLASERALPPLLPELRRAPVAKLDKSRAVAVSPPSNPAAAAPVAAPEPAPSARAIDPAPARESELPPAAAAPTAASVSDTASPPGRPTGEERTVAPARVEAVPSTNPPKRGERWTNSLGIPFVPIPKLPVLVAVWETRVRDVEAFAKAEGGGEISVDRSQPDHPAVNVSYADAVRFCEWLTNTERSAGRLKAGQHYRLPTDLEWSAAAGLLPERGATLRERDDPEDASFAWGAQWPPPPTAGNFRGVNAGSIDTTDPASAGDAFERTAPVGSFPPNRNGLFDMGGNVAELVTDLIAPELGLHATRGGSFEDAGRRALRLRARGVGENKQRGAPHIGFRIVLDPAHAG